MANRKCLFCDVDLKPKGTAKDGKTDEHIIPRWLAEHLGLGNQPVDGRRWDVPSGRVVEQRRQSTGRFVSGRVCADCNNGWMSVLETETIPVLKRLIADPQELSKLTEDERHTVARWTLKTAVVLNKASYGDPRNPLDRPIPKEHARCLKSGALPGGVLIVGAGVSVFSALSNFVQSASWATPSDAFPLRDADRERSYKVGMSFRNVLLGAAYFPNREYDYGLLANRFSVLWNMDRSVMWADDGVGEVPTHTDTPILEGFLGNIFVVSRTWWQIRENALTARLVTIPGTRR